MAALTKKRVYFALHAPEAKRVSVAGTFNDWDADARVMKRDKKGVWRTWMNLPPGEYQYLFVVDGQWREDPGGESRAENPYGSYNTTIRI